MPKNTYSRFKYLKSMLRAALLKPAEYEELKTLAKTFDHKLAEYLIDSKCLIAAK